MRERHELIRLAKGGDESAMMELIGLYMPLILRASRVDGVFDEDCFQHILARIVQAIRKF